MIDSWYTDAWLASNRRIEPPVHTNRNAAVPTSSPRPIGASPCGRLRTRQAIVPIATHATTKATSIDSAVNRPSSEWVNSANGSRRNAGVGPWYMYALPRTMNASIPRIGAGTDR
jgi:hypothetical protein